MKKGDDLEVSGSVVDLLPNRLYRVRLRGGSVVSAHVAGTLQMKIVRLIPGDQVVVKLSDVDPSRGRIIRRIAAGETRR
ncbi:MAG: translation initiation factor IF-1 [Proteobacteria bacterium]|nr:translation initiation factor IF-1 [Pseudomonadota bacterium]